MPAVPYSRYIFGIIPWYSFLIIIGIISAFLLAYIEEKKGFLEKDTVIDFTLVVIPCGIIGARVYYVVFSWDSFKDDLLSVFRIWEGGIAIYGGIIAGLLCAYIFCRKRKVSFLSLCDIFAPGLILAQSVGRWGNYFNQEAYGLPVKDSALCFFPFAIQVSTTAGLQWHMATFFYESVWNIIVFFFLLVARRKLFRYHGDTFFFYAFLYACGRFIIEEFRMDSLYASSTIRVSQLLSILIIMILLIRYYFFFCSKKKGVSYINRILLVLCILSDIFIILRSTKVLQFYEAGVLGAFLILLSCSLLNILTLFLLYYECAEGEVIYADNKG